MTNAAALLLNARSVAIVGASEKPGAPAGYVMKNLNAKGFAGAIFPVHPNATSVFGHTAFPSLSALPEIPDAILVGVAAERVLGVIEEAGSLGIKAAVVLASGFTETGPEGRKLQEQLSHAAKAHGMAICGPNCLGVYNVRSGLALYASTLPPTRAGGVAIVSHSGALGLALAHSGRFGVSRLISAGNGAVTDLADYLEALTDDPETHVIGLVIERVPEPDRVLAAMARIHAAGKHVVALRAGRSAKGAAASAAHTGALAGSDAAFLAFFRRAGIHAVDDMAAFVETSALLSAFGERRPAPGLALVGVSGGGMAHVSDLAETVGLKLPDLSNATRARIASLLPGFATTQNPLDVTGVVFGTPEIYSHVLTALAGDPAIGLVAVVQDVPLGLDATGADEYAGIAGAVAAAWAAGRPVVWIGNVPGGPHPAIAAILAKAGVPVLQGTRPGLAAIAALVAKTPTKTRPVEPSLEPDAIWHARLATGAPLSESEARSFLARHALEGPRERKALNRDAAVAAAITLGFPVVMKIVSADLPHKTEVGGVALGLGSAAAVAAAYDMMIATVATRAPGARIDGVMIQEQVSGGVEAIVGLSRHETFGLTLTVGMGGVLVELLQDGALDILPIGPEAAKELVSRTRLGALLSGYRGSKPADRAALERAIVSLSGIALAYGDVIRAIDLNPVAVLPEGQGVRLLDALVIPHKPG